MRQREPRRKVLIQAKLRAGGPPTEACIRDISSRGMMIQSRIQPPRGTYVEVVTGSQAIVGRVVWGRDFRFGIVTRDKLRIDVVLGELRSPAPEQQTGDMPRAIPRAPARTPTLRPSHARALEFGVMIVFAAAIIVAVATASFETLAGPLRSISAHMTIGG